MSDEPRDLRPQKLNDRHRLMALMVVGGAKDKEISEVVGLSASRLAVVKKSPLFQEQCERYREQLDAKRLDTMAAVMNRLQAEAMPSVERLAYLRDNEDGFVPASVQRAAAADILGYTISKHGNESNETRQMVVISEEAFTRVAQVMVEAGFGPPPGPTQPAPTSIEEFIDSEAAKEAELNDI